MSLFMNIMTSGKRFSTDKNLSGNGSEELDLFVRYVLLNSMIFLGGTLLILFGIQSMRAGALLQGIFDFSMAAVTIVGFILLRTKANFTLSSSLTVVSFLFLCAFLIKSGGIQGSGILWAYSFPLLAIFLLGIRIGTALSIVLGIFLCTVLFSPGLADFAYAPSFALRGIGVYILVTACTVVYEVTKINKDRRLLALTRTIQAERDQIAAMKDNLPSGIFLLDEGLQIQEQYSPKLEQLLMQNNLTGINFISLLSNSLSEKELTLLQDYFGMLLNKSHDKSLLDEINPLKEFPYSPVSKQGTKILSASFTTLSREHGKTFILGSIQDMTKEKQLQAQLDEEERKRQKEMRALFEVVHIEPRLFQDFIDATEESFNTINLLLKNSSKPTGEVIVEMYQLVHAVKSDAVILGLQDFAEKLHQLEREIAQLKDKKTTTFDDMLHLTIQMEQVLQEKDTFQSLVERLGAFTKGSNSVQEEVVLIKTIEKLIEKTTASLGKQACLRITRIDPQALLHVPFRDIKEIITQLVRNALVHGIETPEERVRLGKGNTGQIFLSVELSGNTVRCTVADDGRGINFDLVRDRAVKAGLIPETGAADQEHMAQIIFSPGFSTAEQTTLHGGRGIGLSLVRDRIKKLHGSISLQTRQGRGCRFMVDIPVRANTSGQAV